MGVIAMIGYRGDVKSMWDPNNADEVASAKKQFDDLVKKKKFRAFTVDPSDPNKRGRQVTEFDPSLEKITISPPVAGG